MMQTGEIVHGLWIKGPLSPMELLCIKSYLNAGFLFKLWIYDQPQQYPSMPGLELRNAEEIIPADQVFSYKHSNQFGHGKGSYAGFSDIFRYKLLYENGGWWTDMDVTCISAPNLTSNYLFRLSKQREKMIVGNIMKVPKGSELMRACYEDALDIDEDNRDWMAPIKILNHHIERLGLTQHVAVVSNDDSWPEISRLITGIEKLPATWHFIHWMNEEFRRLGLDKSKYIRRSTYGQFCSQYSLGDRILFFKDGFLYRVKAGRIYYAILHFRRETFLESMYYLGYNLFYAVSDLYFVRIKPHFDIGKLVRNLFGWMLPKKTTRNDAP
jgi:hypothetical protein